MQGEAPAAARLTVVLAEPSRTQAAIIRKYLEELNSDNVHTATSGSEAHALVKECGAQVVISAMHLKDMTGVQLAHALHADPTCAHVGFVLTSSEGESAEIGVATRLPHVTVLAKPFDRELLAQAMARVQAG